MSNVKLVSLCGAIGKRVPIWTQGRGSNISIKVGDELWIKASGFRLDEVSDTHGLACVELARFRSSLTNMPTDDAHAEKMYAEAIGACSRKGPSLGRASMETGFHAFLPKKYVMHFHALSAVLMSHELSTNRAKFEGWVKQNTALKFCYLNASRPGWHLTNDIASDVKSDVYVLSCHGVVLQSDSDAVLSEWEKLENTFYDDFGYALLKAVSNSEVELAKSKQALTEPLPFRIYFPDTAVFLDKLKNLITECGKIDGEAAFCLKHDAWQQDHNNAEIWWAQSLLYRCARALAEVPAEISAAVAGLPTEKFRRGEH